jgi:glycosyltransferase involved in cell wall biosynthesis
MGPVILARAGLTFATKVHGSDLSYTVRPHPERFVPFAREGMEASSAALVGSGHTAEDLWATVGLPGLEERTRLGPPGVDVTVFTAREPAEAERLVRGLADRIAAETEAGAWGRDPAVAVAALRWFADAPGPRVLFVGKLLVNKGVDLLLAAWPLVVREHPEARMLLVGFGEYWPGLERLLGGLAAGDLDEARRVAAAGRSLEGEGPTGSLPILSAFLEDPPPGYAEAGRAAAGSVAMSGRLEHDEVAEVMPAADALVMPSTFPESFGMVAVEAAACGVPPVSADHSGMREVSVVLAEAVGPELAPLLSFAVEPGAVQALAGRIDGWLSLPDSDRARAVDALATRVEELWSWQGVARGVIAASTGDLDALPRVP